MAENEPITEQDVRGLEAALNVARALGQLEPLLRKAIGAHTLIRHLTADIESLKAQKATLGAEITGKRNTAIEQAENECRDMIAAAKKEAERILSDAKTQQGAIQRDLDLKQQAAVDTLQRVQADVVAAQKTLKDLEGMRKTRSEALATEFADLRAQKEALVAGTEAARQQAANERSKITKDIEALKAERQRIRSELSSILSR